MNKKSNDSLIFSVFIFKVDELRIWKLSKTREGFLP